MISAQAAEGDTPRISVIVATRNRAHCLPEVLCGLSQQQCASEFEVVVVDNGSTDSTPAVLSDWRRRDPRFRTTSVPRPGLSRAKNAGVRLARGELLLFTDDDMRIPSGWIEAYRQFFAERGHALELAGGPVTPIPQDLGTWPSWLDPRALVDAGLLDYGEERELRKFEYVWGGNMGIPRTVFDAAGLWNEDAGLKGDGKVTREDTEFFEDTEMQDRVRRIGGATWFCHRAGVSHRVDRQSITPRRIASTAFARGRNDFWQTGLRLWGTPGDFPRYAALRSLLALATGLVSFGVWLALFRISQNARFLERVRQAAFCAGRSFDSLRSGRPSMRLFRGAGRLVFPAQSLLLRLAPD